MYHQTAYENDLDKGDSSSRDDLASDADDNGSNNPNSVDIITDETTTSKDKLNDSSNDNGNAGTDADNSQIDIDSIIGGKYF